MKRGITANGLYEWQFKASSKENSIDLAIFKIDRMTGNMAFDAYLQRGISENRAYQLVKEIESNGFRADRFLPPISTFVKAATDFVNGAFAGNLRRIDIEDIKKSLTFGLASAIFKQADGISMDPSEQRLDQIEKIYRILGNFQLREATLTIAAVESWIWAIIKAPSESTGRTTIKGGVISHTYAKKLLTVLASI